MPDAGRLVGWFWIVHIALWFAAAVFSKPAGQRQTGASRLAHSVFVWAAAILLFEPNLGVPWLTARFVAHRPMVATAGLVCVFAGAVVAWWARFTIGRNWSATVQIKKDHELIQRGPYRWVRHPIYTGFELSMVGTAIVIGQWRGVIAIVLAFIGWILKYRQEEVFMTQQFGARYDDYKRRTKAIIPFVF